MKNNYLFNFISIVSIFLFSFFNAQSPPAIIVDNSMQQEIFGLGGSESGNVTLGLQNEELTGKTFTLNFSLPGDLTAGCTKKITVTRESNLEYVVFANPYFPTAHLNPGENPKVSSILPGDISQSFSLRYRFPAYTTCNGTSGKLNVKIEITCNGQTEIYTKELTIIARAQNTWELKHKSTHNQYRCGDYFVKCDLILHTPNGQDNFYTPYGVYSLTGEIVYTDPIITYWFGEQTYKEQFNDLRTSYSSSGFSGGGQYFCLEEAGGAPPNTSLAYDFNLGDNCMNFNGIINTTSINGNYTTNVYDNVIVTNNNPVIIPGQIQVYEITICKPNPIQNVSNVVLSGIFDMDKITILSVESDGYNSTVQPDGSYSIYFEDIYANTCKIIKFYFTATDNYSEGEYFQHFSSVNYLITPTNNCESCNVEENGEYFSQSVCWTISTPPAGPNVKAQKCIVDPQIGYIVGDIINFRILVRNNGSQIGSASITDNLLSPAQNLTLIGTPAFLGYYNTGPDCNTVGNPLSLDPSVNVQENHINTTLGWNIANMPFDPSKALVFQFSAIVNPQLPGTKTNNVFGAGSNVNVSYDIYEYGELSINKVANVEIADLDDTFTYTITVKNTGTMDLNNVVISDPLPSCVALAGTPTIVDNIGNTIPFTTNGNINFQITNTNLAIGDSFIIQIPVIKTTAATCCNVATVTATVIDFGSTITASHQDTPACVSSPPAPEIVVEKCIIDPQTKYFLGDPIQFRVLVKNTGNTVGDTHLTDELQTLQQSLNLSGTPTFGYYSTGNCAELGTTLPIINPFSVIENHSGNTLDWNITNIPFDPAKVLVLEYSTIVNQQASGTKTNSVFGAGSDVNVSYDIYGYGELTIDKVADVEIAELDDTFTYTITVKNTGTMDLDKVEISDPLPSCVALAGTPTIVDNHGNTIPFTTNGNINFQIPNTNLAVGDSFIIQIPVSKITTDTCCNVVTVNANVINFGSTITSNNNDIPACVTSPPQPIIEVSKCIADPQATYSLGDPIQFRILVKNTGNIAGNIQLIDQLQTSQQLVNLSGIPTFGYYSTGDCAGLGSTLPIANPFSIAENHSTNTLDWNITNMPFDPAKVLVLEFSGNIANNSTAQKTNSVKDGTGNIVASVNYETIRDGNCPELDFKPFKPAVPNIFPAYVMVELNSGNDLIIDKEYGDIDNDGDIDILYTKLGKLHVLINTAGVGNVPVFNATGTPLNLNFPAIGNHLSYLTSGTNAISYRLFDWDNDGDNDLIVLAGREGYAARVAGGVFLFHNNGSGVFSSTPVMLLNAMAFGNDFGWDASNDFPGETNQFIEVGDLNGDNLPDILITGKMRLNGIVYFENNGSGFDLVAPQITSFPTTPSYLFNWIKNPLFPANGGSFQVPELYSKDCSSKLNLFASDPLWYDSANDYYGGGRMYFHENGGNTTSGIFPDFNTTGLINQFGFNDDPTSTLRCDWVVTRFVDFLGNGCPIAIAFNYCTKQYYYYDQECSPGTLTTNTSLNNKSGIMLYPNPTKDWVSFFLPKDLKIQKIIIFDSSGKLVLEPKIFGTKINIENLIQGIYFVHFQTDKGLISEKLIVK